MPATWQRDCELSTWQFVPLLFEDAAGRDQRPQAAADEAVETRVYYQPVQQLIPDRGRRRRRRYRGRRGPLSPAPLPADGQRPRPPRDRRDRRCRRRLSADSPSGRAGTPTTVVPGSTGRTTTAPAPTVAPSPTTESGISTAPEPISTSAPTRTRPVRTAPGSTTEAVGDDDVVIEDRAGVDEDTTADPRVRARCLPAASPGRRARARRSRRRTRSGGPESAARSPAASIASRIVPRPARRAEAERDALEPLGGEAWQVGGAADDRAARRSSARRSRPSRRAGRRNRARPRRRSRGRRWRVRQAGSRRSRAHLSHPRGRRPVASSRAFQPAQPGWSRSTW